MGRKRRTMMLMMKIMILKMTMMVMFIMLIMMRRKIHMTGASTNPKKLTLKKLDLKN